MNSTMRELDNTQFLTYPLKQVASNGNEVFFEGFSACRENCLTQPSFVYFISGYQSPALLSTSFVRVCPPALLNQPISVSSNTLTKKSGLRAGIVVAVVVGTLVGLVLLEGVVYYCFCRGSRFAAEYAQYTLLEYASGALIQFSYKELQKCTKGFREKLGAGGFGAVYHGTLANQTVVAVKQLEGIEQGEKQFRMEVATISSTHHLNLVGLIGFCSEGCHRLLVYEFMKNGSLDCFLFSSMSRLGWETRFSIALGTAKGITYLHEECRDCIIHCDIKPENILLDKNFNAKVLDFGLVKLINPKDHRHRTLMSVRRTRGYLAPEWLANLPITSKSDVYSYGMILLETVSGRRNFDVSEETGQKNFSVWAYEEYDKGNIGGIVDKRLNDNEIDAEQLRRVIEVCFWCIQEQPSQRPTMGKVVQMLEGIMTIERPPAPKALDGTLSITSGSVSVSANSTFAEH
ncbi:G-type lectin S-receptor-like serine/threonine-protein kinase [Acorus gramineus]|uniref:non-specific serine/threonine protein kinase n=1 Tax=Acorus gramineus TaxID=55184 RepID=A0AAV8ZWC1_ACOGR|nr:G-type lectin S-receptor-like serine/threonine-protein kinase [Acorus gramineus]